MRPKTIPCISCGFRILHTVTVKKNSCNNNEPDHHTNYLVSNLEIPRTMSTKATDLILEKFLFSNSSHRKNLQQILAQNLLPQTNTYVSIPLFFLLFSELNNILHHHL